MKRRYFVKRKVLGGGLVYMKKGESCRIGISILSSIMFCLVYFCGLSMRGSAMEFVSSELVILIDDSGSVSTYGDAIIEWAMNTGAYLQDSNTVIHLACFGDSVITLYDGKIDVELSEPKGELSESERGSSESEKKPGEFDLEQYKSKLKELEFKQKYTDQAGAFGFAVDILEQSIADNKCIIMLSDAVLDYADDSKEEEGRKQFRVDVKNFCRGSGQSVILVGFGKHTEMFEGLGGTAKTLLINQSSIQNGQNHDPEPEGRQNSFEDVLHTTFETLGVGLVSPEVRFQGNKMTFSVGEDCYRLILEIDAPMGSVDEKTWDSIVAAKNGNRLERDGYSVLGNKRYLFFSEPSEGEYVVTLPDQNWKGKVIEQKKVDVLNIELQVNGQEGEEFCIREQKFELTVKVGTQGTEEPSDLTGLRVLYCVVPAKVWEADQDVWDSDLDECYQRTVQSLDHEGKLTQTVVLGGHVDEGDVSQNGDQIYICHVIVEQGEKVLCQSKTIQIKAEERVTKLIKTGQKIDVASEFHIPNHKKNCKIKINNEVVFEVDDAGGTSYANYKYEEGRLVFLKTGSYETSIVGDGCEGNTICFEVVTPWQAVANCLKKHLLEER